MFRLWAKLWKDNRMQRDTVIENGDYSMSRTAMVFDAMEKVCYEFDLGQPIWLDANIEDFKRHDKTRFSNVPRITVRYTLQTAFSIFSL